MLMILLACAEPEPCDTLCEAAGFDGVEELGHDDGSVSCACSGGDGLGGALTQEACDAYCAEVGGEPEVQSQSGIDDTCFCSSD